MKNTYDNILFYEICVFYLYVETINHINIWSFCKVMRMVAMYLATKEAITQF